MAFFVAFNTTSDTLIAAVRDENENWYLCHQSNSTKFKVMGESLILTEVFETTTTTIYNAWLDSDAHASMTGGEAQCSTRIGDTHCAWDGYITGKNVELIDNHKIVQTWRTTEFDEADQDSLLTIELIELSGGKTQLTITHTNIPKGQTHYEQGWKEHYFAPMHDFFSEK